MKVFNGIAEFRNAVDTTSATATGTPSPKSRSTCSPMRPVTISGSRRSGRSGERTVLRTAAHGFLVLSAAGPAAQSGESTD